MASVLLSSFGQVAGGPIGGILGNLAAAGADQLLRRRSRSLPDLRVQSSAYGDILPRVYGTTRVSGVLIWASPLARGGGGKGGGGGTDGFVVSLAVALSSRPIEGVGRIWADGREIRNSDGQFASPVTMRVHTGMLGQRPDPLIVAFEGAGATPAYQGLAYAVLEDFPVAAFGNRIPALSFEVTGDPEPVAEDWLADLLAPLPFRKEEEAGPPVAEGYCASGEMLRANAEALATFLGLDLERDGETWSLPRSRRLWAIPMDDLLDAARAGERMAGGLHETDYEGLPGRSEVGYLDPARDYLNGLQAFDTGRTGRTLALGLDVAATAAQARLLAARQLQRGRSDAERISLHVPWKWAQVAPGQLVQLLGRQEVWRVEERAFHPGGIELGCVRAAIQSQHEGLAAEAGRALLAAAQPVPETELMLFEPVVPMWPSRSDELIVVATGQTGWRGAELQWRAPGALDDAPLGRMTANVPHGRSAQPIDPGFPGVWDYCSELHLYAHAGENALQSRPPVAVLQGSNLILLGEELLQFRDVEPGPGGLFVLRGLLRGCLGTDALPHQAGERWTMMFPGNVARIPLVPDWIGGMIHLEAVGPGDRPSAAVEGTTIKGRGRFALAPCHVRIRRTPAGDLSVDWVARHREYFNWNAAVPGSAQPHVVELRSLVNPGLVFRSGSTADSMMTIACATIKEQLGEGAQTIEVVVEAEGSGPEAFRRSRPVHIQI